MKCLTRLAVLLLLLLVAVAVAVAALQVAQLQQQQHVVCLTCWLAALVSSGNSLLLMLMLMRAPLLRT
jgi:hypothetical protein